MLQVTGLRQFNATLQAEKARLERRVTKAYRDYVAKVFKDLLMHTPQYSGQLAASWQILITNETAPARPSWYKKGHTGRFYGERYAPGQMGDGEAVHAAWENAEAKIPRIFWNTSVTFVNSDPHAAAIQADALIPHVRPVNLVNGVVAMAAFVQQRHSRGRLRLGIE